MYRSLALSILTSQLRVGPKYHILDLGPAVGQNIDFFSRYSCKIFVEDLYDTLSSFDFLSPEDGFSYQAVFSYLLPYFKNVRFDIILAWDLFNYLEPEEFQGLVQHLGQFSHDRTILYGMMSTNRHVPETPYRFRIVDSDHLVYEMRSTVLRNSPRYQQSDLDRLMPCFRVCNSFLLRNGYKEYVFLFE